MPKQYLKTKAEKALVITAMIVGGGYLAWTETMNYAAQQVDTVRVYFVDGTEFRVGDQVRAVYGHTPCPGIGMGDNLCVEFPAQNEMPDGKANIMVFYDPLKRDPVTWRLQYQSGRYELFSPKGERISDPRFVQ